ncbi:MAG: hypothetical protein AABX19_02020 [Nanoarchaeota archaeon]
MTKTITKQQRKVKHKEEDIDYDFIRQIENSLEDLKKGRIRRIV